MANLAQSITTPTQVKRSFYERQLARAVQGCAEALYPENDAGVPDWQETDMVPRMLDYIQELPPRNAALIRLMFFAYEFLSWPLIPRLGLRFSKMKVERRLKAIKWLRKVPIYHIRMLGDGLKANMTMIYLSHPSVLTHIGHFKTCRNPGDTYPTNIKRKGSLGLKGKNRLKPTKSSATTTKVAASGTKTKNGRKTKTAVKKKTGAKRTRAKVKVKA